ncbi:MAG: fimbrial assembly protein [Lysobacteraceae bacterium]|jgi:type IV pilus assembly protein PilN|nr:MAG: fimbrial assembly protein [Xanthomonadaceae bacterium]
MANINLLPWRAERRKQREREFYMMLAGTAIAALAVLFAAIFWMSHLIGDQNDRNAYLQTEIKALDKKIEEIQDLDRKRSALLTRKEIIEQLQSNRSQMVHLFDEMVKTIPDGTRLSTMKQAGETLTLEGVAESNSRVATYMRNIDGSPWMGRSDLRKIENKAGTKDVEQKMPFVFSLDVRLRKPEAAKDEDGDGLPDEPVDAPATAPTTAPAAANPDLGAKLEDASRQLMDKQATPAGASAAQPTTPATGEKK